MVIKRSLTQLHTLQGSLVTGNAIVSTILIGEEVAKLWHMRLRHMSGHGMVGLSRIGFPGSQNTSKLKFFKHCVFWESINGQIYQRKAQHEGTLDYIHVDL